MGGAAELREGGRDCVVDVATVEPRYTGAEGFFTDEHHDWIVYATHEGTIALTGTLAEALRNGWAAVGRWRWRGW